MKNTFLSLLMLVALVLSFGAVAPATQAQAVVDNVSVEAGIVHVGAKSNVASGAIEVQKTLGTPKLLLDSTFTFSDNEGTGTGQVVGNQTVLRGYLSEFVFVAGGATVGKTVNVSFDTELFLNPTIQAGATLPVGSRLTFEPYAQLDTPDLLSDNKLRSLTLNLNTSIAVNDRFGFTADVGITNTRADYRFFKQGGQNIPYAYGGVYFTF